MYWIFTATLVIGLGLEAGLLARAYVTGAMKRYTLVYSYLAYVLVTEIICALVDHFSPANYASTYWFFLTGKTLAEFGVLWGVSDSVFRPYPMLRVAGRLLAAIAATAFILLYWAPQGWSSEPSAEHFLNLIKLSALTKALAIAGILAAARTFRIPLGRNTGGILLGFVTYYTISVVNFAAALQFGRSFYENVISWLYPLSFGFCLTIWTFALWKLDPVPDVNKPADGYMGGGGRRQAVQIRRFGTAVTRLLWK